MFPGVAGVGKTVLLNEVRRLVTERGWIHAKVEAGGGPRFRDALAQSLNSSLRSATAHARPDALDRALAVFKSFSLAAAHDGSLALGIDVDPAGGIANTGNLAIDLTELLGELGTAARALGIGCALLIDELQELDSETIAALSGAVHDATQLGLPVVAFAAGLPSVPDLLVAAHGYGERLFDIRTLDAFDDEHAAEALTRATALEHVGWTGDAIRFVLDAAEGHPYFLQVYGKHVWDFALASPISGADARAGVASGRAELDRAFFGTRWQRATAAQQEYLRAMAAVADRRGYARSSTVARHLGRRLSALSSTRDQLLRKGFVYAPDRGTIAFTTPGMAEYVAARP